MHLLPIGIFRNNISRESFEMHLLLRVCRNLLGFPEYWRILSANHENGQTDSLGIYERLQAGMESSEIEDSLRHEIIMVKAWAFLKDGDLENFQKQVDHLTSAIPSDKRSEIILRLANGMVSFSSSQSDSVLKLLNQYILSQNSKSEISHSISLEEINSALGILNRARNLGYSQLNFGSLSGSERGKVTQELDLLSIKIKETIINISDNAVDSKQVLFTSKLMNSFIGNEETIEMIEKGLERYPDDSSLRNALGGLLLEKAQQVTGSQKNQSYIDAFYHFMVLYKDHTYNTEYFSRLLLISKKLEADTSLKPSTYLTETLAKLFADGAQKDVDILARVFGEVLKRDFDKAISQLPKTDEAGSVRPFLNLLAGMCYLEQANKILQENFLSNPELSKGFQLKEFQENHFRTVYNRAKEEFERGIAIDHSYIPLHIDSIKMQLDSVAMGRPLPKNLIKQIREIIELQPEIPQFHFLLALALKKNQDFFLTTEPKSSDLLKLLVEERTVLRRAIQKDASYIDAYLALADTYVKSWRLNATPLRDYKSSTGIYGSPNFKVAITILKNVPAVPKVLHQLAVYSDAYKEPEKTLEYVKNLFLVEPIETNVQRVVHSFLAMQKYEGARNWLDNLDSSRVKKENFEVDRLTLRALVDTVEADSPDTDAYQREILEDAQIVHYRAALELAKNLGVEPPFEAINNLAYVLANHGKGKKALELIKPLIEKLSGSKESVRSEILGDAEETYAWSLYKAGDSHKAVEIYKNLCMKETEVAVHMNYAEVLFNLERFREALQQIEVIFNSDSNFPAIEQKARRLKEEIKAVL